MLDAPRRAWMAVPVKERIGVRKIRQHHPYAIARSPREVHRLESLDERRHRPILRLHPTPSDRDVLRTDARTEFERIRAEESAVGVISGKSPVLCLNGFPEKPRHFVNEINTGIVGKEVIGVVSRPAGQPVASGATRDEICSARTGDPVLASAPIDEAAKADA